MIYEWDELNDVISKAIIINPDYENDIREFRTDIPAGILLEQYFNGLVDLVMSIAGQRNLNTIIANKSVLRGSILLSNSIYGNLNKDPQFEKDPNYMFTYKFINIFKCDFLSEKDSYIYMLYYPEDNDKPRNNNNLDEDLDLEQGNLLTHDFRLTAIKLINRK